jgi:acetyl/propionyl-CoA carboxylase alpha subunit
MQHEAFITGKFETKFIEKYFQPEMLKQAGDAEAAAYSASLFYHKEQAAQQTTEAVQVESNWLSNRKEY